VGFRRILAAIVTAVVMLWVNSAGAQEYQPAHIKVLVLDSVKLSPSLIRRAETEAGHLFRQAGIEIHWVNCSKPGDADNCHHVPRADEFMLHIVHDGRTQSDLVFGEAFLGEDGTGKYSDVFFDRIRDAAGDPGLGVVNLLGAVSAHELGHLLLGTRSHSLIGIMEPVWAHESLRRIGMGTLLFTHEQSQLMKRRLDRGRVSLALRVANRGVFEPLY
jgi:hypothetical protein